MTMDELNALYNNMSVYGDTYTTPITTIPKDPNAGQSPILEPLIPIVKQLGPVNQSGDNDNGITTLKNNIGPTYNLKGLGEGINPSNNKSGIAGLLEFLQKISPMANIMKLGKTGIETAQKYFADKKEDQRLEALAQIEQARKQKEAQAAIAAAEKEQQVIESIRQQYAAQGRDYGQGAADGSGGYNEGDGGSYSGASTQDYGGGEKDGGHIDGTNRRRYGMGGIVSL